MIYQFDSAAGLFAVTPECKKWKWCMDNGKILAYLEPRDGVDTSSWIVAQNVPAETEAWLKRV